MKKLTAMLMAGIMTLGLVGCGSSTTSETTTETPKATETVATTQTATEIGTQAWACSVSSIILQESSKTGSRMSAKVRWVR